MRDAAQCVITTDPAAVDVSVRFLHVVRRQVMDAGAPVDELVVDGERLVSWEEAVEREIGPGPISIAPGREVEGPISHLGRAARPRRAPDRAAAAGAGA